MPTKYMAIKASVRPTKGVNVDGKEMRFAAKNGSFTTSDPGLAKEINARFGAKGEELPGEAVVVPIENAGRSDGHKTTFSVPELPWKKNS